MLMFWTGFMLSCISGSVADTGDPLIYLPYAEPVSQDDSYLKKDARYCLRFTWLGNSFENMTFPEVMNKTCSDFFIKDPRLCIDPMAVTYTGKKPNITYLLKNHARITTCKLSEGQVCAKYTIYHNGIETYVVRYCTRIDIESEGQMTHGCLTENQGPKSYEVCACLSGPGEEGICNAAFHFALNHWFVTALLMHLFGTWKLLGK